MSLNDDDSRVEDYLNDKLQTHADLENLDALLRNVKNQQDLLRQQLVEAETALEESSLASKSHKSNLVAKARKFQQQQGEIDRRLLIVTNSETSDVAVRKFSESMERLGRLDVAKGYVELLKTVERLGSEARKNFKVSPQGALKPYLELQALTNALKQAQPAAEDAAPHLVDHVDNTTQALWKQMKEAFASEFEATLKKMKWPGKEVSMEGGLDQEWSEGVEKLLELQEPELAARDREESGGSRDQDQLVLLPLEVMIKPLEMRFQYHFEGDKSTNKLDKPEYFLSHVVGLLNTYEEFFIVYLQPILNQHFRGSNLGLNPLYTDSTSALITAVLPMVRRKVFILLRQISKQPQLLSHLMHELMSFDTSLRDDWGYDGGQGAEGWKGLTWEVLMKQEWFGTWLQAEKDFALSRYESIINQPESGEIDYDSVDPGITKPTKAAIRVNDLLETVTDRYRPLSSFSQRLRFLIDIQISIFDKFHQRLHSSLEAYLTMTSSIARTVQGISKEEQAQLQGLGGLERLCRVYGSAEYLEKKMRDWSDDLFFLELWDELQHRARGHTRNNSNLAGSMSIEDVAGRTSSVVGSGDDSGALFDETSAAYRRLRIRAEEIILENLTYNTQSSMKPYSRINPWASLAPVSPSSGSFAISAELDSTVQQLSANLGFLAKVLADAPLRRITRQVALAVQTYLWDNVLMRHHFSAAGVAQLKFDVEAIWSVLERYAGSSGGKSGMRKLAEAIELLSIPSEVGGDQDGQADGEGAKTSIWQVEKRIFMNNESAREVLEELGMEALSESEARNVLEKRVELGN